MRQTLFNITILLLVTAVGLRVAISDEAPHQEQGEVTIRQQLDLLAQKVVVLSARQADERALREELEKLQEMIREMQQKLQNQPSLLREADDLNSLRDPEKQWASA